jgi:hypothetical protein
MLISLRDDLFFSFSFKHPAKPHMGDSTRGFSLPEVVVDDGLFSSR